MGAVTRLHAPAANSSSDQVHHRDIAYDDDHILNWTSQNLDSYCILHTMSIHRPRQEGLGHFSHQAFVRPHTEQCQRPPNPRQDLSNLVKI